MSSTMTDENILATAINVGNLFPLPINQHRNIKSVHDDKSTRDVTGIVVTEKRHL
jgi:hypothetical protein